jgi:group I intron endonuclease
MFQETQKIWSLYRITNKINNKVYIGQATDVSKRWSDHRRAVRINNPTQIIHSAMIKYGVDNFEFNIIASCNNINDANEVETLLVKQYESHISTGKGYNISLGGRNAPISEETKQKMSMAKIGKKHPLQHIQNISDALKGKPAHNKGQSRSAEVKNKISESMQRIIFSEDHKNNLSIANTGNKHSEESKQKMRKPKSEETKRKMSEARKRYWANKK